MGTNYYWEWPAFRCTACGHVEPEDRIHIGKSSGGWCFALHVTDDLRSLEDWKSFWAAKPGQGRIVDDGGQVLSADAMLKIITERSWAGPTSTDVEFLRRNYAEPGPNGLLRHRIGRAAVGHGEGTWDLVAGEFS